MAPQTLNRVEQRNGSEPESSAQDQGKAIAALSPNLAILKMENENIMSLAAAHPRDMKQIKADLQEALDAFPQLAEDSIYNKPVGTVNLITCKCGFVYESTSNKAEDMKCAKCNKVDISNQRKVKKFARGLSIKAAETLAEVYGFNRVRTDVEVIDADTVKIEVTFTDYQRGRIWQDAGIVSKFYKGFGGAMQRTPDDRFYNVVLKAEKSKLIREAINRSVNAGLKAWFWGECEKIQDTLLDDSTVAKIITNFATKNVSLEMIERLLGRPKVAGWTTDDRKTLAGAWTALKDGETTIGELFGNDDEPGTGSGRGSAPSGPVTGDSLTGGRATSGNKPAAAGENTAGDKKPADDPMEKLKTAIADAKSLHEVNAVMSEARTAVEGSKTLTAEHFETLADLANKRLGQIAEASKATLDRLKKVVSHTKDERELKLAQEEIAAVAAKGELSPDQQEELASAVDLKRGAFQDEQAPKSKKNGSK